MNEKEELSYGESQRASIQLRSETYPDELNVAFTRGFVSSQAFVDKYGGDAAVAKLLPGNANDGLKFKPTHPQKDEAYDWMGFEAREIILKLLDDAIADTTAKVSVVCYDLNEPEVLSRLQKLGKRVRVIIDDDGAHGKKGSAEDQAEALLVKSAGRDNVKRQHMGKLQHNKMIIVNGTRSSTKAAIGGSTNFSWRGFFVQNNNAVLVKGAQAIKPFIDAFENYFENDNEASKFGKTQSATWNKLGLPNVDARVSFSPHSSTNAMLKGIAKDMATTQSSLFFSLAFLYQTKGAIRNAISKVHKDNDLFCYGISDKAVGGLDVTKPDGKVVVIQPAQLKKNVPEPFKTEASGGKGVRMHHKFVVIDFNKPNARVYTGSYNFSDAADTSNGENLWLIKDQRVATAYAVEALAMFDHYYFRVIQQDAKKKRKSLTLQKPPKTKKEKPWWDEDYSDERKKLDRELFS